MGTIAIVFTAWVISQTQVGAPPSGQTPVWEKFIPISQLGIALSLAYLALPAFRHMQLLASRGADLIGKSSDERIGFATMLNARRKAQTDTWPELMAIVAIFYLMESRVAARSGRAFEPALPRDQAATPIVTVGAAGTWAAWNLVRYRYDELRGMPCINNSAARKRLIGTYFVGADIAVVVAGAGLALAAHVFSLAEAILPTHPSAELREPLIQAGIAVALLVWSCGAPIYFALQGSRLTEAIDDFAAAARAQHSAAVAKDEAEVKTAVVNAAEAARASRPGRRPGRAAPAG